MTTSHRSAKLFFSSTVEDYHSTARPYPKKPKQLITLQNWFNYHLFACKKSEINSWTCSVLSVYLYPACWWTLRPHWSWRFINDGATPPSKQHLCICLVLVVYYTASSLHRRSTLTCIRTSLLSPHLFRVCNSISQSSLFPSFNSVFLSLLLTFFTYPFP